MNLEKTPGRRLMIGALLMLAASSTPTFADQGDLVRSLGRDVIGAWIAENVQEAAAPGGATAYLRNSVTFTPDLETLKVEAFADRDLKQRLFTYESSGPYRLLAPSRSVPGAVEADLTNNASLVTIHVDAPDIWKAINLGGCPLAVGKAVEISGCVSGPPFNTSKCVDMDLVHVESNRLRFGDQRVDRCKTRPVELDRTVYIRQRP